MATTREQFFKLLQKISVQLDQPKITVSSSRAGPISLSLGPVTAVLEEIKTLLTTIDASVTGVAKDVSVDGIEALLTTIDTSLDAIEVDADASRISLSAIEVDADATRISTAAIDTNTDGIEAKLDTIDASVQDVEGNTGLFGVNTIANISADLILANIENEVDNLEEQAEMRFQYKLDTEITVTGVGGGTKVWVTIQPTSANPIRHHTIAVIASVLNDNSGTTIKVKDGTGTSAKVNRIWSVATLSVSAPVMWPEQREFSETKFSLGTQVINDDTIHIEIDGVDTDDVIAISIRSQAKESSGTPTVATTNTTATISTVETRNEIDSA